MMNCNAIPPAPLVTVGDDFTIPAQLYQNGAKASLASATINALLLDSTGTVLIPSTAQSSAYTGANWATGYVIVVFPKALTAALPVGDAYVEYQVTVNGSLQTFEPKQINVVAQGPGFIPQTLTPNEWALAYEIFNIPQLGTAYAASQVATLYGPAGEPYDFTFLTQRLNACLSAMKPPQVARLRIKFRRWDEIGATRQVIITKGANGTEGQLQNDELERRDIRKVVGNILGFWSPPGGFYMEKQKVYCGGRIMR